MAELDFFQLMDSSPEQLGELIKKDQSLLHRKDDDNRTLLHWSSSRNRPAITEMLLSLGASADLTDDTGMTPLIISSSAGSAENVELLVQEKMININKRTNDGRTALHYACSKGHSSIIRQLLDEGANPKLKDHLGWNTLHRAVASRKPGAVQLLVDHDTSYIDDQTKEGDTALHLAAQEENEEIVKILIKAGASREIENKEKKLAREYGPETLRGLLRR